MGLLGRPVRPVPPPVPAGAGGPGVGPGRMLRRRPGPLQLALVGALVTLVFLVEVLILGAYVSSSEATAAYGKANSLTGNVTGAQRELLLLSAQVEQMPATRSLKAVELRRALLGYQLHVAGAQGADDPLVTATVRALDQDLTKIDRSLARVRARPSEASLRAEVAAMRPVLRAMERRTRELDDKQEQVFFGAVGDALAARSGSERLLVGLSGLVLLVGVALALSLRQRVRSDFARAWQAVVAEAEERKQLEAQLVHQAYHDGLTGLANRTLFADRVQHALAGDGNEGVAVLFVDLDDFKHVNDSLGHDAGDQLLVAAAKRLESCLRATDTAARFGSDEFALLLEGVASPEAASTAASRVIDTLHQPFGLLGKSIPIKASVGVALGQARLVAADELLRNADVAMYAAKAQGKDRYELFQPHMHADMLHRLELEADLRRAVERDELVLHYQPIVELATGRITGVEALVRWAHPTKGLLAPAAFVPLAEEQGLIGPIGRWVLHEACWQARRWQADHPDLPGLGMHVNLSSRQLDQPGLVGEVGHALEASGLEAGLLTLEITETVLMADTDTMSARLADLKGLGVRLAIDDFGTGYSSLSYLRRFPVDVLKIDKAFVDGIDNGTQDATLAHAIVNLSRTLGLEAIAEGIERADQVRLLIAFGCGTGQGHHFAKALSPRAMGLLLDEAGSHGEMPSPKAGRRRRGAGQAAPSV